MGIRVLLAVSTRCGVLLFSGAFASADASPRILTTRQAMWRLERLPRRIEFREVARPKGASGALAGRIYGRHGNYLNLGVALGRDPERGPVPDAGTLNWTVDPGFVFSDDSLVRAHNHLIANPRLRTGNRISEAGTIVVEIEEELCRAATGRPCPV